MSATPGRVDRPNTLIDALNIPVIGRLLKKRHGRLLFQIPLFIVAALMLYDGFTDKQQIASRNLATVGAWVHYRGLIVLALLLAGNLFCMGCPFTLPRTLARRLSKRGRRFPKALRNKWLSIAGLFLIFYLYEALDLWASPLLTAWVALAYFGGSFVLELAFTESAFCKYVCPLGAFNFVYSTTSPLQITEKSAAVCRTCVGRECVNGSYAEKPIILVDQITDGVPIKSHTHDPDGVLGCGLELYVPQVKGNMDCTMCLDCVRACPHDNIALAVRNPSRELLNPAAWARRWDVGFLVVVLAFMGLSNAFGMIPPIYALMTGLAEMTGIRAEWVLLLGVFVVGNLLLPAAMSIGAAWLTLRFVGKPKRPRPRRLRDTFAAFAPAFVPIGLGVWASHYGFHFVIGALTVVPVFQNFLIDHNIFVLGSVPSWELGGIATPGQFAIVQVVLIIGGYLGSMLIARRIAAQRFGPKALHAFLPWALVFLLMMLFAFWVFSQPMEMRGLSEVIH